MNFDVKFDKMTFEKKTAISGVLEVKEKLPGPITLSLESSRCSLDMKNCVHFSVMNFKEMCKKFVDTSAMYTAFFGKITPPLKCPIAPGNYTVADTDLNMNTFEYMPIDGYFYNTVMKLNSAGKLAWCFKSEVKIVKLRV